MTKLRNIRQKEKPRSLTARLWWEQRESNPRPSACKADALNQLSYAPETGLQIYGHFSNPQILFHDSDNIFAEVAYLLLYLQSQKSFGSVLDRDEKLFNGDVLVLTASDIGR